MALEVIANLIVPDDPPKFTSIPPMNVTEGIRYFYDSDAIDPEGETLTYSLIKAPSGTNIDKTDGRSAWTPGDSAPSTVGFILRVGRTRDRPEVISYHGIYWLNCELEYFSVFSWYFRGSPSL